MPDTDRLFDVELEFDTLRLAVEKDPVRTIAEASRHKAESFATEHGLTLRHPDPREVVTSNAIDPLTGRGVTLVATRWIADR